MLLPTAPIGENDHKPTPTGAMIVDFARGRFFAKPPGDGGLNLVDVADVGRAHVAALERGRIGERYLIGGENVSYDALWEMLESVTGVLAPSWRIPAGVAFALAWIDELRCREFESRPIVPLEGVQMMKHRMFVDSSKAERELDHRPSSAIEALRRAVAWYRTHGYID
ncbi:MAG: hypothetical protein JOY59_09375 [Candidatus Eremiobacteraeota bacterium]|nr:hypothetical protein [Candidatus Eremiobacteraeota bacterium]